MAYLITLQEGGAGMPRSNPSTETRTCAVCETEFSFVRTVGQAPQLCGDECRREATRRRVRRHYKRLTDARDQLKALQATQAA